MRELVIPGKKANQRGRAIFEVTRINTRDVVHYVYGMDKAWCIALDGLHVR
jgi:hypothetical protein